MGTIKGKKRKAARGEFEVAYSTKKLGRSRQRELLRRRLDDFSDSTAAAASHGEDVTPEREAPPPREDRAG
jgi:hypothetical protein